MKTLLIFLMIGLPFNVCAGNAYHDYLMAAQTELNEMAYGRLGSTEMNSIGSWIEDAQFRFNSGSPASNIDIKKNALSYEFRFKPKAWGQRSIEKDIINIRLKQQDLVYKKLLNDALQKRYLKLIEYFQQYKSLQNSLASFELLMQESVLIQSQVSSEQFNPEDLLDTEEALKQNHSSLELSRRRLYAMQSELGLPEDNIETMMNNSEMDWVLNSAEIQQIISSFKEEESMSPDVLDAQMKLQLSQSENELTEAKQQLGINLVKFEYSDRVTDEMAFQVGINIPLGASFNNSKDTNNLQLAHAQLSNNMAKTRQSLSELSRKIKWLSEDWEMLEKQMDRGKKYIQKDYAKSNPFLMINLRKQMLNNKQKKTDLNRKALGLYVSYLALKGQLTEQPLRNWIQQGTPLLTETKMH